MPERDWDADEIYAGKIAHAFEGFVVQNELGISIEGWQAALAERRRLAALLAWKPGPPTEPGDYLIKFKAFPALHCHCCADDLANGVGAGPLAEWHLGPLPLPEPPKAEVAG